MKLSPKYIIALTFCAGLLLAVTGYLFLTEVELDRPWKAYQRQFKALDRQLAAAEREEAMKLPDGEEKTAKLATLDKRLAALAAQPVAIKQLWLTDFGLTDRCLTCHQRVEQPRFQAAPQPLTAHPGNHLDPRRHPVDSYGCVICHAGHGVALEADAAHGKEAHWVTPFLPGARAESSCAGCHPMRTDLPRSAALPDAPTYSRGRALYLESNCLGCHVLDNHERAKGIGPKLTALATKTNAGWFRAWVKKPKDYLARTVMPDFELADGDIRAMSAYLFSLNKPLASDPETRKAMNFPDMEKQGKAKLTALGCLGCHTIDGKNEGFAPDLARIGEKATPEWLSAWIKDPQKYWPETAMPNLRVPEEDIRLLAAYLATRNGEAPIKPEEAPRDEKTIAAGRLLVRDKGCTGCHKIDDFALGFNAPPHDNLGVKRVDELVFGKTEIPRTLPDWLTLKLRDPRAFNTKEMPTLMPKFGFSKEQAENLTTFLLGQREFKVPAAYRKPLLDPTSPLVKGELLLERHNCRGCHKIGEKGGDIGPSLADEGRKVAPEWLTAFLLKPRKIRPEGLLPTRMPTFGFSEEEAGALAAYFVIQAGGSYPYSREEKQTLDQEARDAAWKNYWQDFSCQACHAWNGIGGIVGPDQSDLGNRLRREWIAKWLKTPQAITPDVRMPNFELYPEEVERLATLLTGFSDISPAVWEQMRRRWEDEQLARQAGDKGGK